MMWHFNNVKCLQNTGGHSHRALYYFLQEIRSRDSRGRERIIYLNSIPKTQMPMTFTWY